VPHAPSRILTEDDFSDFLAHSVGHADSDDEEESEEESKVEIIDLRTGETVADLTRDPEIAKVQIDWMY